MSDEPLFVTKAARLDPSVLDHDERPGALTALTCPERQGPILETRSGGLAPFRCRVGYAFTTEAMAESQAEHIENAMWTVINSLQESAELYAYPATITTKRHRTEKAATPPGGRSPYASAWKPCAR